MKIAIATDHNGPELKKEIIRYLNNHSIEVIDLSPSNSTVDDYPNYAYLVGNAILSKEADFGILICGTGIGMSIAANKIKGIYCAHVSNVNEASLARKHNNANVIAFGKNNSVNDALKMVDVFINTNFSNEARHKRRNLLIKDIESGEYNV